MLIFLTLALITVAFQTTAHARHRTCAPSLRDGCTHPPAIVSMGDSYLSGEAGRWAGNADTGAGGSAWGTDRAAVYCNADETSCDHYLPRVYGNTSYDRGGNRCDRSYSAPITTAAYPGVPAERRFDIACSGATTYEFTHAYDEKGERPQIEQLKDLAREYRVKMVVVSVGGNDLKFKDIVESCAKRYLAPSWWFVDYCKDAWGDMRGELDAVEAKVTRTLKDIRKALEDLGYEEADYRLVMQSYPAPIPPGSDYRYPEKYVRYTSGGCPFYNTDSDWARDTLVGGMGDRLRRAASETGATFLDVKNAFTGHELCAKEDRQATEGNSTKNPLKSQEAEWVRWIPYLYFSGLPWASQGDQQESLHPNYFGQLALGKCLTRLGEELQLTTRTTFECLNDGRNGADGMSVTRTP
ncbi:GDSL-type esterase/lipase family protein [Streptomyces sp. NPDC051173]|uniref:GDSL-type esterase/lipase family protein n=1 Tax=Streptomyces sp. NPDC051173 TaxID=3155164 RepID=UPI00345027BA